MSSQKKCIGVFIVLFAMLILFSSFSSVVFAEDGEGCCGNNGPGDGGADPPIYPTTCSDGTASGACSSSRPLFCNNGALISKALTCGCPAGQTAQGDICAAPAQKCSDDTVYGQCSTSKPYFCSNGNLINKSSVCGCPSGKIAEGDNCRILGATYTKNSFPTYSGNVIACNNDDLRISCQDSGDGNNHGCSPFGINGCQAFEGSENYGSPGCLITCEQSAVQQRCSDGTEYGQCSTTKPLFCNEGTLINKASICGCAEGSVPQGDSCVIAVQRCSDGTEYGQCSVSKPLFCNNGNLINKAGVCGCPYGKVAQGDSCVIAVQRCSDGTEYGQCSINKPLFCNDGTLINKASACGCPSGKIAEGDNCVTREQSCSDGTLYNQCSSNKPLFCRYGYLINKASICGCPYGKVAQGDNCVFQSQACNDGTQFNQCSDERPLFCNNGVLVNRASICGCQSGTVRQGENCIPQAEQCSDGTLFNQCSATRPLFCSNGILFSRASFCGCPSGYIRDGDFCQSENNENRRPLIISFPVTNGKKNQQYTYDVQAFDPDNDALTYSISSNAPGISINPANGLISFAPALSGSFFVSVTVSDGQLSDTQTYTLAISEENDNGGDGDTGKISGMLEIIDVDAEIDGKKTSVKEGKEISREARSESTVVLKIKVRNNFPKSNGQKIEDIFVTAAIEDIDHNADLEDDASSFDLKPGDDKTVTLRFKLPLDVNADNYNIRIEAEGDDEDGNTQDDDFDAELEVIRSNNDLRILDFTIAPQTIRCSRSLDASYRIINLGLDDDVASFELTSEIDGIRFTDNGLEIKSESGANTLLKSHKIKINGDIEPGVYEITGNAISESSQIADTKKIELNVEDCLDLKESNEPVILLTPKTNITETDDSLKKKTTTTQIYFNSRAGKALAILGFLGTGFFFLILIILLLVYLFRKD